MSHRVVSASEALRLLGKRQKGKASSSYEPEENHQEAVSSAAARAAHVLEFSETFMKRVREYVREPLVIPPCNRYDGHERDEPQPTSKHGSSAPPPPKATVSEATASCMDRTHESAAWPGARFADIDDIIIDVDVILKGRPPFKAEWSDKQPGKMKAIYLSHLPQKELLNLARKTFQDIHGNISEQTIAALLVLAYNIMNDEGDYLTAEYCPDIVDIPSSLNYDELSDMTRMRGSGKTITEEIHRNHHDGRNDMRLCMAYTYLAASYMRLFTKSAENYLKIGNHLKTSFQNFYSFSFPLDNFHPDLNTIQFIRRQFEFRCDYRNTFYVFLYASCENTSGENLKDFLYVSHISYTGLHPYVLFLRVMDALNKDNITLANVLYTLQFKIPLDEIMNVFTKLVKAKEGHDLQMWRFGRIFDRGFLRKLQTKDCVVFTLMLAYILMEKDPIGNKGVLEITQIKGATDESKKQAFVFALRSIRILEGNEAISHYK